MKRLDGAAQVCALVPHHRCERWLEQALSSLLEQTRMLDAIVVVDDGSGEPPVDIVEAFPEVTLVATPDNGGPYRAIQAVIDATDFDAYLFQDADDWSAPDRLAVLLEEAERTGAELVGSHEVRVLVTEGDVVPVRYPLDVNAALRERPTSFPLLHPTSLISGDLVRRLGGFATGMRFSGDAELLRRAGHVARIVNADHLGYYRRKRQGSLTLGSDTELGSPARLAVQSVLADRARANAERVARGELPDLTPLSIAPTPELRHLAGPALGDRLAHRRRDAHPHVDLPPIFVLGAPRAGHGALAWALGQHPNLRVLPDARWLGRLASDIEARTSEEAAPAPPEARPALAAALAAAAGTGGFVASGTDLLAVVHALDALFPTARFVHVVRDVDDATAAVHASPTADGAFFGVAAAWRSWLTSTELGLAAEAAFGSERALRVRWDELVAAPEEALRRCLAMVGLEPVPACVRPLRDLAATTEPAWTEPPPVHVASGARQVNERAMAPQPVAAPDPAARRALRERFDRERAAAQAGGSHVEQVRSLIAASVPDGATVAVVSRGDPRLVDLGGRVGWHLPQESDGTYAGHHPADSDDALAQLDALRARGADHLVIPASSLWWLTYYDGLRRHLDLEATVVAYHRDVGLVFELAPTLPTAPSDDAPAPPRLVPVPVDRRPEVNA